MSEELTPVPCGCGGEAIMGIACHVHEDYAFRVECRECKIVTPFYDTKAEAITAWNRAMSGVVYPCTTPNSVYTSCCTITNTSSPNEDFHPVRDCMVGKERTTKVKVVEKPNVFKCSECGQYFHRTAWGSPVEYCSRCGARLEWE